MKINFLLSCVLLIIFSCNRSNELEKYLNCKTHKSINSVKEVDSKNSFSIQIPKNWNINLYSDALQSSIFIADTAKQLTQTLLLDFNLVSKKINLDADFLLQEELLQLQNKLVKIKELNISTKNKQQVVIFYRGKKNDLPYQTMHQFVAFDNNFMHIKAEVYGENNIQTRFCEAQNIINTLKIK